MAITVKHKFVSTIPDDPDATLIRPSNWNDTHDLVGTVPIANGGTNATTAADALTNLGAFPATSTTGTGSVVLDTGATQTHPTISDYEIFTSTTPPSYAEGRVWFDSLNHTLAQFNDVTNNTVHLGEEIQLKVINNTGSTINIGQPVYITGTSSGQTYPNVALAIANTLATSNVIGLANQAIPSGTAGYVTTIGLIQGINTGTYTVGDTLYLSPYSAGFYQNTIPPTGYAVKLGTVAYVNSSTGAIYINKSNLSVQAGNIVGQVALTNGGTNANLTASAGSIPYSTSTALALSAVGTSGQVLTSAGTSAPTWTTPATGTVTSVGGTGTVSGISLSGTVTSSGNLTLGGTLDLSSPPAIGGTTPNTGVFSLISSTRINPRVTNTASTATLTPASDSNDQVSVTALAVGMTIAIPSGTPVAAQKLTIRIKDNGTPQTLTWTTSAGGYRVIGCTLPTTTVASKVIYVGCIYNATESFWDVVSVAQQI